MTVRARWPGRRRRPRRPLLRGAPGRRTRRCRRRCTPTRSTAATTAGTLTPSPTTPSGSPRPTARSSASPLCTPTFLDGIYVRADLKGQGIGSLLLDVVEATHPDGYELWVFESNAGARRLYERRGLVEVERTDGSGNEEKAPDIRMAWRP